VSTTASVSGRVSVAPALSARVNPQDTVFILARPVDGPRMPLAVLRKQVKDLPASFTLDDSMAMAPGAKISGQAKVIITARISKTGEAMPQPGDLIGESAPVAPGAEGVAIEIAEVVSR
jgi:cytochrome c-type biogenesis protein CcmH